MFCSRCGNHVGISDVECAVCSASLNAPGAIRLIDPKLDPDFVPQIPGQDDDAQGEESVGGDDSIDDAPADDAEDSAADADSLGEEAESDEEIEDSSEDLDGSDEEVDGLSEDSDEIEDTENPDETVEEVPSDVEESDDEAETEPSDEDSEDEDSEELDQEQPEEDAAGEEPEEGAEDSESGEAEDSEGDDEAVGTEEDEAEQEAKESRFASTRENAKAKFAVVNDRVQATFDEVRNPSTENIRAVERSLGLEPDRIPRQKVTAALIILFLAIACSGVLMAQLINLDKTLLGTRPLPESTLSVAPEPSSTANRPDMDMDEGAKECEGGVWAGEHTSCELAKAAADQVKEITEPKTIKVTIGEEKQEFELSCAVDKGVTCRGTDDSQEIAVWVTR